MVDAEFFDVELLLLLEFLLAPGPPVLQPVFLVSFDVDVLDAEVSGSSFCFYRSASVFTVTLLLSTLYHFPL